MVQEAYVYKEAEKLLEPASVAGRTVWNISTGVVEYAQVGTPLVIGDTYIIPDTGVQPDDDFTGTGLGVAGEPFTLLAEPPVWTLTPLQRIVTAPSLATQVDDLGLNATTAVRWIGQNVGLVITSAIPTYDVANILWMPYQFRDANGQSPQLSIISSTTSFVQSSTTPITAQFLFQGI